MNELRLNLIVKTRFDDDEFRNALTDMMRALVHLKVIEWARITTPPVQKEGD